MTMRTAALLSLFVLLHLVCAKPRIVGGEDSRRLRVRRVALLRTEFESGLTASCTASVLAPRWLLTAAHCFVGASIFTPLVKSRSYALVGEKNPTATADTATEPALYFAKVFVHSRFRRATNDYRFDIALVKLRRPIPVEKYLPVVIGPPPTPETVVKAVGYGVLGEFRSFPRAVQTADVVVKSLGDCAIYERPAIGKFLKPSRTVCAVSIGYPNVGRTDTCYGDSGGPLFRFLHGQLVQFAVTSFSTSTCAAPGGRAYYTRLDIYEALVKKRVEQNEGWQWKQVA